MKKILSIILTIIVASVALAQTQPDAEYNLIRRSYKVNSDGTMDIRYRKEIKLLRNRAIVAYADKGETFISYNPAFETLTINECYTIREDGTKVVTPTNAFVEQLPSECTDCGRLNDIREMAIVHTALEPNCTIVLDYTIHRKSKLLVERFNLNQDCPVKHYEIRYADGHTQVENDIPQTVNDPYMPARKGYDVEFQLGITPHFDAETTLPIAETTLNLIKASLQEYSGKAYIAAIRDWVIDYIHLNPVDLARTDYTMSPAYDVFTSNCGTILDKTGLLAAMLNQAGFNATLIDNSLNVLLDRPMEVEIAVEGQTYRINALQKNALLTQAQQADAANLAAAPIYKSSTLQWKPDTLSDGYLRITIPDEPDGLHINPALLAPSRTSDLQAKATSEFYHYTLDLPKGAKLIGGDINIEYDRSDVGSITLIIKQKGKRILITRSLRLRKAIITKNDYQAFRQLMIDWNSHKDLIFSL